MQAEKREAAPAQMDQGGIILVETKAIVHNLEILKKQIKTPIMAVVKNNGYGLGLTEYAAFLQDQGITRFGVKDGEEALRLRAAGIRGEIFLLAPVLDVPQLVRLIRSDAVLCVDSMMTAQCAKRAGYLAAQTPCVQLKVDTGLGRYGFLPGEAAQAADVAALFQLKGIYTHFAEPYSDPRFTKLQYERFETFIGQLQHLGVQTGLRHCCATGGALRFARMHMDMVRIGSGLLGRTPDAEKLGLAKVGKMAVQVAAVKQLPAGWNVGYGRHARLKKPLKVGILQAGAQMGLFAGRQETAVGPLRYLARAVRALSGKRRLCVYVRGKKAQVVGMVGINHVAIDLSGISCREGELAIAQCNPALCPAQMPRIWSD